MYDSDKEAYENKYFPSEIFKGFGTRKIRFIFSSIKAARKVDTIILSHINLLLVGWLIKKLFPKKRLILFAHGIEIWGGLDIRKRNMLKSCDIFFPVSHFTSTKIQQIQKVNADKCIVLNNCLDPFMQLGNELIGNNSLREKYGYKNNDQILFTLTRLSSKERYKGYDRVLNALVKVKETHPDVKYLIAGRYDELEKKYLFEIAEKLGLKDSFKLAGFISDEELVAHFRMANLYVMPSMKEGFGIVFIEAMYYGLPVVAGNLDGSVDALCNGKLGLLVNPEDTSAIEAALINIMDNGSTFVPDRELLMSSFSYESYKKKLESALLYN